jgi:arsenate reductase
MDDYATSMRTGSMSTTWLYHNPSCTKSRRALELLRARGIEPTIVAYLQEAPSIEELRDLLKLLAMPVRALLRTGETEYAQLGLEDPAMGEDALIAAMHAHPRLIERPIFVHRGRAVIGRPAERVLELLD